MSELEKFDDHIKNEFSNYSPEVPPQIWDRIIAEREKRRPVGFWFRIIGNERLLWAGGILLAVLTGTGLFFLYHSSTSRVTIVNENNMPVADNTKTAIRNKPLSSVTVKNNYNISPINTRVESPKVNNVSTYKNETTGTNQATDKKTRNQILTGNDLMTSYKIKPPRTVYHLNGIYTSTKVDNSSHDEGNHKDLSVNNYKTKPSLPGINLFTGNKDDMITTDQKMPINSNNPINEDLQNSYLTTVQKLSSGSVNGILVPKEKNIPGISLPECPTVEKDAAANKRYFEVYIAPDYGIRTLTDTANAVYLAKRKASSSFTSGFSAGVRYTKVFANGMSLRGGLNYSQINERFSFVQGSVVQITYTIDPNTGDTTGSYTVRGTRYLTTYNHYRSMDVPLTIGYEFGNGKLHTNINAGIIVNIYSWQKGDVLDTNFQPVNITTGEGSSIYQFKTNVGLGATGGVSFYYKLTEQLHLLGEPYVRYNFQPMSSNNLTLRQKYTTIGLRLGLRVDLP